MGFCVENMGTSRGSLNLIGFSVGLTLGDEHDFILTLCIFSRRA